MTAPPEASAASERPLRLDGRDPGALTEAARLLRRGAVVVLPTDTGYGLAASMFQPASVERVFIIKQRDASLRLPLLIPTAADLPLLVREVPPLAWRLIGAFWPGPLSLVLPATEAVPKVVVAGRATVAVRVPNSYACLQVLQFLGEPVTGTSANLSRQPSATTAAEALEQLGAAIDAIVVDDAALIHPRASTVAEIDGGVLTIHREGAISSDALRALASPHTALPRLR